MHFKTDTAARDTAHWPVAIPLQLGNPSFWPILSTLTVIKVSLVVFNAHKGGDSHEDSGGQSQF
jgi:hypothetical protein